LLALFASLVEWLVVPSMTVAEKVSEMNYGKSVNQQHQQ
jgi:hypothetical protein